MVGDRPSESRKLARGIDRREAGKSPQLAKLVASGWPSASQAMKWAPDSPCILDRTFAVYGKFAWPRTSITPLTRSTIWRSLRRAASVAVVAVIAITAIPWMVISGIRIWLRIDDRIRSPGPRTLETGGSHHRALF